MSESERPKLGRGRPLVGCFIEAIRLPLVREAVTVSCLEKQSDSLIEAAAVLYRPLQLF